MRPGEYWKLIPVSERFPVCTQIDWTIPKRCLLLGACGAGMRTLTQILLGAGHVVTGADLQHPDPSESRRHGILFVGWHRIPPSGAFDVCIVSRAIVESAPLRIWAEQEAVPCIPLLQAVNSLFAGTSQVCVAGTHGKSTTSGLLAWILSDGASYAGSFLGAEISTPLPLVPIHEGGLSVIESCEYSESYLSLQPYFVLLTGIDGDHFDCFSDLAQEQASYRRFVSKLPSDGWLLRPHACRRSADVARHTECNDGTFSFGSGGGGTADQEHWHGSLRGCNSGESTIRIRVGQTRFADVRVPLYGAHNGRNVTAAVAMANRLGTSAKQCVLRLREFPGIRRRLESRGTWRGMTMLDDYAHHPTAVATTLRAVRNRFHGRSLRIVFEPHQVLRTTRLMNSFASALCQADDVGVLAVYPARETVSSATCHRISVQLAATIRETGSRAEPLVSLEHAIRRLESCGQSGDVILTMGAGQVHRIHDEIHRPIQRNSAA